MKSEKIKTDGIRSKKSLEKRVSIANRVPKNSKNNEIFSKTQSEGKNVKSVNKSLKAKNQEIAP